MVLIIPINFLLLFLILYLSGLNAGKSLIRSYLIIFCFTAIATEVLSYFSLLSYQFVLGLWVILCVGLLIAVLSQSHSKDRFLEIWARLVLNLKELSRLDILLFIFIIFILLITLIIAVLAPPNNYDSMTYHMARVANWIQHKSVRFYPTSIPRQNYSMPLAEYFILHLQLLGKSDHYANLIQWSGFVILTLLAAELAGRFSQQKRSQLLAGVFTATLPMAILQSTNTQNDIITAVFCLIFADSIIAVIKGFSWEAAAVGGIAFGLALLTKGTAYLFCAAIGSVFGLGGLITSYRKHRLKLLPYFAAMIGCAVVINAGFLSRNWSLYGNILSPDTGHVTADKVTPTGLYSNLVRNGVMHLALPFPRINQRLTQITRDHLGDLVTDPRTTFPGSSFQIRYLINEDDAGNLIHFVLMTGVILAVPFINRQRDLLVDLYLGSVILCILLFSGLLKWQPWGGRLQLTAFALMAPLFGYLIGRIKVKAAIGFLIGAGLMVYSLPYLFLNSTRPLVPLFPRSSALRSNQVKRFFSDRPELYREYAEIIAPFYKDISVLHTPRQRLYYTSNMSFYQDYVNVSQKIEDLDEDYIGLHLAGNDWEYPLWVLAGRHFSEGYPIFIHVGVNDRSGNLEPIAETSPVYVISSNSADREYLAGGGYQLILDTPALDLFGK